MEPREALSAVKNDMGLPFSMKKQQEDILINLCNNRHTFAELPTGFGKSLIFAMFPLMKDKICPGIRHLALVVCPLNALMRDQVDRWRKVGVSCAAILGKTAMCEEDVTDIMEGNCSVVFTSPEAILDNRRPWWTVVLEQQRERVCLIAIDEVHCMMTWGDTFRADYLELPRIRAVLRDTPILMLTATATRHCMQEVTAAFSVSSDTVAVLPDRPEIYIKVESGSNDFENRLEWVLEELRRDRENTAKILIYTRDIDTAAEIAGLLIDELGDAAYASEERSASTRLVDLYHGEAHPADQERILLSFVNQSSLRVVVATVAFGMGVEIPDVRKVIMWGPPKDLLTFWQQAGRAGRDGKSSEAMMYLFPHSVNKRFIADDMVAVCNNFTNECVRRQILRHFSLNSSTDAELSAVGAKPRCCTTCDL